MLQRVAECCSVSRCAAVCCSVQTEVDKGTDIVARERVCCSVLQRVAACCSVLQYVTMCCGVLWCVVKKTRCVVVQRGRRGQGHDAARERSVLQCDAACCGVMQFVAV